MYDISLFAYLGRKYIALYFAVVVIKEVIRNDVLNLLPPFVCYVVVATPSVAIALFLNNDGGVI